MNLLLSLLLLVAPAPVKTEHGRFSITKDGKAIGTDEFDVSRRGSNYVFEGKTIIGDITIASRLEVTEKLVPVSYEATSTGGTTRVTVGSPTSELQTVVNGETSSADFRFPDGGVILDNDLFDHYLILMYRVQTGQTNFPVFVPQNRRIRSATVQSTGNRAMTSKLGKCACKPLSIATAR